jgi:chlorophyllide a reductase subunit Z
MYKEFGETLAESLGQPYLFAPIGIKNTTRFITELGELLGTSEQAKAFIQQEKKTTLQSVWDIWKGPQGDWFNSSDVGIAATRTYAEGLESYLGDELGMDVTFVAPRPAKPGDMSNSDVRKLLHDKAPSFVYGSINERIYLAEAGAKRSSFMPAAFPGAAVLRSVGTPFMGYRGTVYIIQEIVNCLYDTLFNFLPLDAAYNKAASGGPPAGRVRSSEPGNMPWSDEATKVLDEALDKLPYLARISASRELQMHVEAAAQSRGLKEVTPDVAEEVLSAQKKSSAVSNGSNES